jgi:hypothetical protein
MTFFHFWYILIIEKVNHLKQPYAVGQSLELLSKIYEIIKQKLTLFFCFALVEFTYAKDEVLTWKWFQIIKLSRISCITPIRIHFKLCSNEGGLCYFLTCLSKTQLIHLILNMQNAYLHHLCMRKIWNFGVLKGSQVHSYYPIIQSQYFSGFWN